MDSEEVSDHHIDYPALWEYVIQAPHCREQYSVHGPDHWLRVERNGCILAARTGAKAHIVRLFALFHDSKRLNEGHDPGHGSRGGKFARELHGHFFELSDEDLSLLIYACNTHTEGVHHDDPTIGTCWDSDRLDIGRVGMRPSSAYMSTDFAKEIADYGTTQPWLHLAETYLDDPISHHLKYRNWGEN